MVSERSRKLAGGRLLNIHGRSCSFVEHPNVDLVVAAEDSRSILFKPEVLGCYIIHVNRT